MALYLNNAATTWPKPDGVPEAMAAFLRAGGANLARGSAASRDLATLDLVTTCRERLATLLGGHAGGDPRYVTFTANVTEALNVVLKGLLRPGMRVLTSSMEHNAVIRPLRGLEAAGVRVEVLPCSSEGFLDPGTLRDALKEPADLMVLSHGSNVCGALQDLDALASLCDGAGVPLVLDAAQTAGVLPLDAIGSAPSRLLATRGLSFVALETPALFLRSLPLPRALSGGLLQELITDSRTAVALLEEEEQAEFALLLG